MTSVENNMRLRFFQSVVLDFAFGSCVDHLILISRNADNPRKILCNVERFSVSHKCSM